MNYGHFLKEWYMQMFGTTEWLGIDIGFYLAMICTILVVIAMNVVFWNLKPKSNTDSQ